MKLSRTLLIAVAGLTLAAATAPATATTPAQPAAAPAAIWAPGTYNWYSGPQHHQLVGYMIVECDGTIRGPYPGPGGMWAEITMYEEYIPLSC